MESGYGELSWRRRGGGFRQEEKPARVIPISDL